MSRSAIPGNFFLRRKFGKGNWDEKSELFGLKLRHSLQTSIHRYKKINLRNWKDFSRENLYFVFFRFRLEAWNFVFLSANGSRWAKRAPKNNPRKIFLDNKRKKMAFEWHFSVLSAEPLVGVCQNTASITTKWTSCEKKKFWEFFYFVYLFSRLEDKILFIWDKTEAVCQIVSRRLVRWKSCCG